LQHLIVPLPEAAFYIKDSSGERLRQDIISLRNDPTIPGNQ